MSEAQTAETAGLKTLAELLIILSAETQTFSPRFKCHTHFQLFKKYIVSFLQHNHLSNFAAHSEDMTFPNVMICVMTLDY